jgi:subtilisin family serine protease
MHKTIPAGKATKTVRLKTKPDPPEPWARKLGFPVDSPAGDPNDPIIAVIDDGIVGHEDLKDRFEQIDVGAQPISNSDHATAVAGVIGAIRGNSKGIVGCCEARLKVFSVFPRNQQKAATPAFRRALSKIRDDEKVRVVNLSFGGLDYDLVTDRLIGDCTRKGVVFVAAMGSNEGETSEYYPACYSDVIAVGATTADLETALNGSNMGSHVWISAPGENIKTLSGTNQTSFESGTSYATAMVSGAVWEVLRRNPNLTPQQVRTLLMLSTKRSKLSWDKRLGWGCLDVKKLLKNVSVFAGNAQ